MPFILHITCDYPDQIDRNKTIAISNLVQNAQGFKHYVLSLNRTYYPWNEKIIKSNNNLYSISYLRMPYAILLRRFSNRIAKQLYELIIRENIKPDLIHCHKLTHEGIVGLYLSQHLGIPLTCSVRGDTDLKLLKITPVYHALYRKILDHAKRVFFIAPWTMEKIKRWHGTEIVDKALVLPNIVNLSFGMLKEKQKITNRFVTVCHLKFYKRKNIARIIRAVDRCISAGSDITLDIIGSGPEAMIKKARHEISKSRHPRNFRLLGHMDHSDVASSLWNYAGLVLPSYPETFGMVYLEALQSGIPFIHSRDAGVDGYFSDYQVSISVDPKSVESIEKGISKLFENQKAYKENIKNLMDSGALDRFNVRSIIKLYEDTISSVLRQPS